MARYWPVWLEIATEQYNSLSPELQRQVDVKLDELLDDPEHGGVYDKASDQWTATFGGGLGLIVYAIVAQNVKVIVLRLIA